MFFFLKEKVCLHRSLGSVFAAIVFTRDNPELNRAGIWGTALVWSRTPAGWHLEDHQDLLRMSLGKADGKVNGLRGPCGIIVLFCAERLLVSALISNTVLLPTAPCLLKIPLKCFGLHNCAQPLTFLFKTNSATRNLYKNGGGGGGGKRPKTLLPITCNLLSFL